MRLLQICNAGRITGGTAACAWTVCRALPGVDHTVVFLSGVSSETRQAFSGCRLLCARQVTPALVARCRPDAVLLHNTPRGRVDRRIAAPTVQYLHSQIDPAPADKSIYCSRWLADRYGADSADVCQQAVPRPPRPDGVVDERALRDEPVVGRLCPPTRSKWPYGLAGFYSRLAGRFPRVRWEFVGCPGDLRPELQRACRGRAAFHAASWHARSLFWRWDALLYHNPCLTESFGRTAAEAMRAGCIPVVDDAGGFREQVRPGGGFLCGETSEFERAIEAITPAPTRWLMSRASMAHAHAEFSLARFRKDLARLPGLDRILAASRPARDDNLAASL